jgi:hypothetical protein
MFRIYGNLPGKEVRNWDIPITYKEEPRKLYTNFVTVPTNACVGCLAWKKDIEKAWEILIGKFWAGNHLESRSADERYIELAQDSVTSRNLLLLAYTFRLLLLQQ